jgi:hypothetical protein
MTKWECLSEKDLSGNIKIGKDKTTNSKMKKSFIFKFLLSAIFVFAVMTAALAQTHKTFIYTEVSFASVNMKDGKCRMEMDFGRKVPAGVLTTPLALVDENGKYIVFNSPIDGLNFLGREGWEIISFIPETKDSSKSYLMKMETTGFTDEQVNGILSSYKIKKDFK